MERTIWYCESCEHDLQTKEAYCEHLTSRCIGFNLDTIEAEMRRRAEDRDKGLRDEWVMKNGVLRQEGEA